MSGDPYSEAFTTLRICNGVALGVQQHLHRLEKHANQLGIATANINFHDIKLPLLEEALVRVSISFDSVVSVVARDAPRLHQNLAAMEYPFPGVGDFISLDASDNAEPANARDIKHVIGLKHGAWDYYKTATAVCKDNNVDVALLTKQDTIVDGDRATPVLIAASGNLLVADARFGGVESVTLGLLEGGLAQLGYKIHRTQLTRQKLFDAVEVLMVGSGVGVARIVSLDGVALGEQQSSHKMLSSLFDQIVQK